MESAGSRRADRARIASNASGQHNTSRRHQSRNFITPRYTRRAREKLRDGTLALRPANGEGPKVQRRKLRSTLARLGEQVVGRTIPELGPQRDLMLLPETVEAQPKPGNVWTRLVMIELEAGASDTVGPLPRATGTWRLIVGPGLAGREHGASPGPKHTPELPQRRVAVRSKGQGINAHNAVGRGIREAPSRRTRRRETERAL